MLDRKWIFVVLALGAALACEREDTATPTSTSSATGTIGVAECDDYLTKYDECVSRKAPAADRTALRESVAQMRTSWQEAARNPAVRRGLASGCSRALEAAKQTLVAYQCRW
jgi:hypothetical protein